MGVDYTGHYGVGVQIKFDNLKEKISFEYNVDIDDVEGYYLEYLDTLVNNTNYNYFEVGEGAYTGHENDYYIYIQNPFEDGYNIESKVKELESFCDKVGLIRVGNVDEIGGIEVY